MQWQFDNEVSKAAIAARDKRIAELDAQLALAESRTHVVLDFLGLPHYFDLLGAVKSLHESNSTKADRITELERDNALNIATIHDAHEAIAAHKERPPFLAPGFAVVSHDAIKRHLDTIASSGSSRRACGERHATH